MKRLILGLILLAAMFLTIGGCQNRKSKVAPAEPPAIPISHPVQRMVTDYVDFTGRTDAVQAVDIRARVTGYLDSLAFKEGSEVKKGDLLAEIDPRPYEAQYEQSLGMVKLYEAALQLAKTTYARDRSIAARSPGAVSQQQLDQDMAAVAEADARVKAYISMTKVYKLNLDFCKVASPISGMVSRYYMTVGNLILQDQTLITTVVSLDPMNVYFDMDEPTLLMIRRALAQGRIIPSANGVYSVLMGLQGEEGFPHKGTINFTNNQVNPNTGSISVRGVFANPNLIQLINTVSALGQAASGHPTDVAGWLALTRMRPPSIRLLSPGMFVRVRLPVGEPHPGLLVIDRAIGSDQGLKYVYLLDKDNKVQTRRVTTGPLQEDGLRVITDGLQPNDWVVVGGLPQIKPGMEIKAEKRTMPTMIQAESNRPLPPPGSDPPQPDKGAKEKAR